MILGPLAGNAGNVDDKICPPNGGPAGMRPAGENLAGLKFLARQSRRRRLQLALALPPARPPAIP